MPKPAERESHVRLKIERARRHYQELQAAIAAFLGTKPFEVGVEVREGGGTIYYVKKADPVPDYIALITGDIIQNLMTALDHLAYQLVCANTADNPPDVKGIYFPIADDAVKYDKTKGKKLNGAAAAAIAALDGLKPYKGGDNVLWQLHGLNIIEKHRLLLTVGSQLDGINFVGLTPEEFFKPFPGPGGKMISHQGREVMKNAFFRIKSGKFPLVEGMELLRSSLPPTADQGFTFDIGLLEAGADLKGAPVVKLMETMIERVEAVAAALKAHIG